MQRTHRGPGFWISLILISFIIGNFIQMHMSDANRPVYSNLVSDIKAEMVEYLLIENKDVSVRLKDGKEYTVEIPSKEIFYDTCGEMIDAQMAAGTLKQKAHTPVVTFMGVLSVVLPVIVIAVILIVMMNKNTKGNNFTKSRARIEIDEKGKISFADVAGAVEEKEELSELVEFLKNPKKFIELGARIPKGVLLVGPPGTGKTLLARAIAGEAGVPFFSISGSDFVELYVGVGASRVRDLFEQAKKNRPCIIFIDEIDAVGRRRGAGMGGGHDEREQTLNQLLVEMDGFGKNEGVIMIAATNRPDILDPALLRPGRFDRQVVVGLPNVKGREEIFKVHAKNKPLEDDVDLNKLAKATVGCSGADIENLMNEAAIFAARRGNKKITNKDLDDANVKVMMGAEKKSSVVTEKERKLTAYHEAGHAVVTKLIDDSSEVNQVSIIPRGRAGGYTMHLPKEDKTTISKNEMLNRIMVLMGGRAAEEIVLSDISTGASSDLERATEIAHNMVSKYGMTEAIGPVAYGSGEEVFIGRDLAHSKAYSEKTAAEIDDEVKRIMVMQYKKTVELLKENINSLDAVAKLLLEEETIDGAQFEKCMEDVKKQLNAENNNE